jgi:hypothetical protein
VCGKTDGALEDVVSVNAGFNTPASTIKIAPSKPAFMTVLGISENYWTLL